MKHTPREHQILDLLLRGFDGAEMAKQLGIKHRTVKMHMTSLFRRYGLEGATGIKRVKLAVLVFRERRKLGHH